MGPGIREAENTPPAGWPRAVALAETQAGAIAYEQLREAGLSSSAIGRRIARGDLTPRHDGVHALGRPTLTPFGETWAAALAAGDRGALTRWSGAALLGLARLPGRPQLLVVGGPLRLSGVDVSRTRSLEADEIVAVGGLRVVAWPRLLVEAAPRASVAELQSVLDRLERRRELSLDELEAAMSRRAGKRGLKKLVAALAPFTTIPAADYRSLLERFSAMVLHPAGLGDHEINGAVELRSGRTIHVDVLFHSRRLAVEVDGRDPHDASIAFETDRERDRELQKLGFVVLRFSWRDVMHRPHVVVRDIRACLAR